MSQTNIASGSAQSAKLYGAALFAQAQKKAGTFRGLTGKKPTVTEVEGKIGKQQTDPGMPIVELYDLTKTAGDRASMDCIDVVTGQPIMGDEQAEGKGSALSFSSMEVKIDQWTFPVNAGGRMSQQRTPHDLRRLARASAVGLAARYFEQRNLVQLAGARGTINSADWVIPLASHAKYNGIMINDVKAPTFNRHFVVNGNNIVAGGQQLSALASTDTLKLNHIDALRNVIDNLDLTLQPVTLPEDNAAGDNPMWVMYVPADVYSSLLAEGSLRAFQQYAVNRAQSGGLAQHPLFAGECGMWNGILVKKMQRAIRYLPGESTNIVTSANAATATETAQAVNAGLTAGFAMNRCMLLGAQALVNAYGKDAASGTHYSWAEKMHNFDREPEFAVFGVEGSAKVRFNAPDANGDAVPTDHGVIILDVAAKLSAA
jgi:N4-gp56 family major capsid protein